MAPQVRASTGRFEATCPPPAPRREAAIFRPLLGGRGQSRRSGCGKGYLQETGFTLAPPTIGADMIFGQHMMSSREPSDEHCLPGSRCKNRPARLIWPASEYYLKTKWSERTGWRKREILTVGEPMPWNALGSSLTARSCLLVSVFIGGLLKARWRTSVLRAQMVG